ncbi:glycosyltransferase family 61 protein [Commensalibacter oyaizuii]|uniref:Glycosyltransferase family 61 protein n=1 Tax=Commensalibacter oyaizuii TaxID=3043873 RepID=A0ABT6Q3F6_9PROT|nr:glycosyltransferase family 61 protein [Commensalibacter sp. TBRC 16381]MDI2091651.1 glycosyltransferase family 61 protein [Commensalibacter sp. TBRC 16381]
MFSIIKKYFKKKYNSKKISIKSTSQDLYLHQVAIEQKEVEYCELCDGQLVWPGVQNLSNQHYYPFFNWKSAAKPIYRYRLKNIVLDSYYKVFFKDGKAIIDSSHYINGDLLKSLSVRPEHLISYEAQGIVFSCFDHWEDNYFHWLAHAIPAFYAAKLSGVQGKYLIPAELTVWQRRTLELLGIDFSQCVEIKKDKQYAFSILDYYELATGEADFVNSKISVQAYAAMVENVAIPVTSELCHDKIYISRATKQHRHLRNESELIAALKQRGYFILDPEQYTIDQQIIIFQHAKIVVALLGAGLSNIAFCKENTLIYELIPSHHDNPCFLTMSLQGKLRYWADRLETGVDHNRPDHLSDWVNPVDVNFVMMRLDELEALA